MSSENYRYYHLDGTGRIHEAEWFEAEGDADAIARIVAQLGNSTCEIWQGKRLVASVSPKRLQA